MKFTTLILDDEKLVRSSMKRILASEENDILTAETYAEASEILKNKSVDLLLLDYKLKEIDGVSVLKEVMLDYPDLRVIMLTAYASIDLAVTAMKYGAFDFLQKEQRTEVIHYAVRRALDHMRLHKEVEELRSKNQDDLNLPQIIAKSSEMNSVVALAMEYAKTDATVLISGETGTGKNLLARMIHQRSSRFNGEFIPVNCAAIPRELMESELFGYEKGSFTGAHRDGKTGLIKQASGGTLLLDEIGELNIELQTKLLHVLESGEFFPIGAVKPTKVDVRFIACSNADLPQLIRSNRFRSDLYYRLNVAHVHIPALRERRMDLIPIAKLFIDQFNHKFNKNITKIEEAAESFLLTADWPGNVRELRNYVERGVLLAKGNSLLLENMICSGDENISLDRHGKSAFSINVDPMPGLNLLHEVQDRLVQKVLESVDGNKTMAARVLGIPRTSLNHYIKRLKGQL